MRMEFVKPVGASINAHKYANCELTNIKYLSCIMIYAGPGCRNALLKKYIEKIK